MAVTAQDEWVSVGSPGNPDDPQTGFGSVPYHYRIGKFEVTNQQYIEFLNAVAATDTYALWDANMETFARCGITRTGTSGNYTYSIKPNMASKPVNYVSWFDMARFCNWLHNGKPIGFQDATTTEDGAYTVSSGGTVVRNGNARFFLPTENEWYKAAYFDPSLNTGAGGYWLYPTRSNDSPVTANADASGNVTNPGFNVVNWKSAASWNGQAGNVTTVGSAGLNSVSPWGAFDMGGNVEEMNETIIGSNRGFRGGSWNLGGACSPVSTSRNTTDGIPGAQYQSRGFRLATVSDTADTDADGLVDWIEVSQYGTNPHVADTDGDGFSDGFEVATGFDPASGLSTPEVQSTIMTAVEFRFNGANGVSYRIESSTDLSSWTTVESPIVGTGGTMVRFYSIEGQQRRFLRARRN